MAACHVGHAVSAACPGCQRRCMLSPEAGQWKSGTLAVRLYGGVYADSLPVEEVTACRAANASRVVCEPLGPLVWSHVACGMDPLRGGM